MPFVAETTFHVRYAETDKMGIVHHAAFVVWLEEGRSQWLRSHGSSYANFEREGFSLAVTALNVRYKQAAYYDQRVTVQCWVEAVQSRKMSFGYAVLDAETGDTLITAATQHICLNQQGKVTTIPEKWRRYMNQ